ncbi:hypothetical protein AB0D46_24880 [Streptomyces sp. NPDC048383]|uniref:hypothetical protein n=1 Tax=Streptomyces sp. NPDC048383 TaxID=3155386 RepID=UPI0034266A9F
MNKNGAFSARRTVTAALLALIVSLTVSAGTAQAAEAATSTPANAIKLTNGWG